MAVGLGGMSLTWGPLAEKSLNNVEGGRNIHTAMQYAVDMNGVIGNLIEDNVLDDSEAAQAFCCGQVWSRSSYLGMAGK